jgi:hypothetical protein
MASLADIRARLLQEENKSKGNSRGGMDNAIYPFWNIPEGSTATLRFLPDADESNTFFWRERQMIRIEFAGIKGGETNKKVTVTVPCVEMWNETCPVHAAIRPWFKDKRMEETARKYWKKRSYLFQGFVVNSPLQEDTLPENQIRRFVINSSIFNIIKTALMDPEMVELPTDYMQGTDFRLAKTTKGQYADYSTSSWARKERSLNEQELGSVAQFGLYNLNDFMPKKPNAEELNAIYEMFEASVDGELYDPARWANFYKPAGFSTGSGTTATADDLDEDTPAPVASRPAPVATPAPAAPAPVETPSVTTSGAGKPSVDDLLSMIRNRKQA